MEYYVAIIRNAFESVLMRWMNLESIIQNEVSQKEKNKYNVLMHIYIYMESGKMVLMNLLAGQQWRHREQTYGHGGQGRKERMGQMERVAWKHIHEYMENR